MQFTQQERERAIAYLDIVTSQRGALVRQDSLRNPDKGYARWAVETVCKFNAATDALEFLCDGKNSLGQGFDQAREALAKSKGDAE